MTEKQYELLEEFDMKASDARISTGVCELILNETQEENPTEQEAISAYKTVRILAQSLFDRLRIDAAELKKIHDEIEKELQG